MILRQKSALDGFTYEFLEDGTSMVIGDFRYPWFSQAKNARLRLYRPEDAIEGDIQLKLNGHAWRIRHLHLRRGYTNDVRYTLEAADETIHAQMDVLKGESRLSQPLMVMDQPTPAELSTSSGWFRKKYTLMDRKTRHSLGNIQERSIITTKRELQIDLPSFEPSVAAFWGIMTLIVRF
ncbi:hypothetical protein [Acidovorax sp.]|uniref:hypothetical protein n=1 Tax=Acidovorax sp. TaxID=1872122 RepID=UPI002620904B|nr:hypothetical protein [Acidovorax sp.]